MLHNAYAQANFKPFTSSHVIRMLSNMAATQSELSPSIVDVPSEAFSEILRLLYSEELAARGWQPFLDALRTLLKANFASIIIRPGDVNKLGLVVSAAGDPHAIEPYDPMLDHSPFKDLVCDHVVTVQCLLSENEWRESSFYKDYCARHDAFHIMALNVRANNGSIYALRITRPESAPAFSEQDMSIVRLLLPHLRTALLHHLSSHQDQQMITLYGQAMAQLMVGVLILDQNGMVMQANPSATQILRQEDGLRLHNGMLEATYSNDNRKLQKLIKDALMHAATSRQTTTEGMSVVRQSGQMNWGVVVQSITPDEWSEGKQGPCVAVFMRDTSGKTEPPVKLAQQIFQLTPAETSLAIRLANGASLEEAAEELNIKRNTARAHLRSIFSKTGVRRQTELVRIFLNSVAWLGNQ